MASEKKPTLSFFENFALSGAAAVISKTAAAPIDRVKLLLQNQPEMLKQGVLREPYTEAVDCAKRTLQNEGLVSFWRGNFANCLRYFPSQALNFAFKDKIKAFFKVNKSESHVATFCKNIASGGSAAALSLCFIYPLDYARTRLANDTKSSKGDGKRKFNGLLDIFKKTLKSDGIAGLYRGFVISCFGIVYYRGFYFGLYDSLKPLLLGDHANLASSFALGYCVTVTSGLISYPFDTVRRRMMMTSGQAVKYNGSIDCIMQIFKNEGPKSFMKGAGANILRGVFYQDLINFKKCISEPKYPITSKLYIVVRVKHMK